MLARGAWFCGFAAVAVVCLFGAPASAGVTVTGDRSAYEQLLAAY